MVRSSGALAAAEARYFKNRSLVAPIPLNSSLSQKSGMAPTALSMFDRCQLNKALLCGRLEERANFRGTNLPRLRHLLDDLDYLGQRGASVSELEQQHRG